MNYKTIYIKDSFGAVVISAVLPEGADLIFPRETIVNIPTNNPAIPWRVEVK